MDMLLTYLAGNLAPTVELPFHLIEVQPSNATLEIDHVAVPMLGSCHSASR